MYDRVSVMRKSICALAWAGIMLGVNLVAAEVSQEADGFSVDYAVLTRASGGDTGRAVRVLVRGEVVGTGGARRVRPGLEDSGQWELRISLSAGDGADAKRSLYLKVEKLTCRRDTRCQAVVRGESGTLVKLELVRTKETEAWAFVWKGVLPLPPGGDLGPVVSSVRLCMRDGRLCRSETISFEQHEWGTLVATRGR